MRPYLASLVLGVLVGVLYGLVKVRSPAPPAIALLGLLGMLAGEQAVSLVKPYVFRSGAQPGAASGGPPSPAAANDVGDTEKK